MAAIEKWVFSIAFALGAGLIPIAAQTVVDASAPVGPPPASSFKPGSSVAPHGSTIGLNARYLTRDGKPWLPVMGEFHYSRVPETLWEEEILKMKAAGVDIVAAYVIWIHQEEMEGEWDWTGQRDLRRFTQLCARHGMYVYPRIGPWVHAEVRNGGFPDWLLAKGLRLRSNDPAYLAEVDKLYRQIALQLKGLLWKDGGPVIGIQLENEYNRHGAGQGEEHIRELKRMAVADGFDVPLYTVTGWGNASVPKGEVVGVFGGYPATPWVGSLNTLPPQEVYAFRFSDRVTGNMGMMDAGRTAPASTYDDPFLTVEMGGGTQDTYHSRPVLQPDDVAAMVPVMLGSGVNLYGSYMFQGGENPEGKRTTLQESQATRYPNDMAVKDYDFQAPLGAYGEERPVLRKLKVFDYFLQEFGPLLAPLVVHAPAVLPTGPRDLSVPRVSVRSNGQDGFIFFNNYVRDAQMPARKAFQVQVKLASETIAVPATPIDLPSGAYGIWPINLKLGKATLRYATAQPLTVLRNGKEVTYYFVETPGVEARFSFAEADRKLVHTDQPGQALRTHRTPTGELVLEPADGIPDFSVEAAGGGRVSIAVLRTKDAEQAWRVKLRGVESVLFTPNQFYADAQQAVLQNDPRSSDTAFRFFIFPFPIKPPETDRRIYADDLVDFIGAAGPKTIPVKLDKLADAGEIGPVKRGTSPAGKQGLARMPAEADWNQASRWEVTFAARDWALGRELFLAVDYDGDVARLYSGGKLLTDQFYNGKPWRVGLVRYRAQIEKGGLELRILPRRLDAPLYLEPAARNAGTTGQVVKLKGVTLEPQYELRLKLD